MVTTYAAKRETDVTLRDGSTVHLRPLTAGDREALAEFLAGLSLRSRAFRFFSAGVSPAAAARRSVSLHYPDRFGLAVADDLQGHGLGTILLGAISEIAAANGYGSLVAEVLPDNHRMLDMFADCGLPLHVRAEPGVVHVRMPSGVPLAVGSGGIPLTVGRG